MESSKKSLLYSLTYAIWILDEHSKRLNVQDGNISLAGELFLYISRHAYHLFIIFIYDMFIIIVYFSYGNMHILQIIWTYILYVINNVFTFTYK